MAYGSGALSLLAAVVRRRSGSHSTMDPCQRTAWRGISLEQVRTTQSSLADEYMFHLSEK
jgi:hypothetical protein